MVKKAVAPAMRRGSFFLNNIKDCRRLVINNDNLLDPDLFSGMMEAKIKRCILHVLHPVIMHEQNALPAFVSVTNKGPFNHSKNLLKLIADQQK